MNSIKGTETEKNLLKSFAGESQARMRYNYFAYKAKEEGFPVISSIFEETANHEREHAKRFFKFLEGGMLNIEASFPAGKIGTTAENLLASINGEHEEASSMYPEFAKKAREEGFEAIAKVFENVAEAEKYHETRFKKLLDSLEAKTMFKLQGKKVVWKCTNCGFHTIAEEAPLVCPACGHKQSYFIMVDEELF